MANGILPPLGVERIVLLRPVCRCSASTGIHELPDADGSASRPWGLTFGSGKLNSSGYWEIPCAECARWHEKQDRVPVGSYWPWNRQ